MPNKRPFDNMDTGNDNDKGATGKYEEVNEKIIACFTEWRGHIVNFLEQIKENETINATDLRALHKDLCEKMEEHKKQFKRNVLMLLIKDMQDCQFPAEADGNSCDERSGLTKEVHVILRFIGMHIHLWNCEVHGSCDISCLLQQEEVDTAKVLDTTEHLARVLDDMVDHVRASLAG